MPKRPHAADFMDYSLPKVNLAGSSVSLSSLESEAVDMRVECRAWTLSCSPHLRRLVLKSIECSLADHSPEASEETTPAASNVIDDSVMRRLGGEHGQGC
ncbi:hypothetical protein SpCBS45565_g01078 [Spizellomyces sp. 'palustris']|nr:hypothetical protein SpCBS45565_g01078 [Spizellomyces sp. 'palustris']